MGKIPFKIKDLGIIINPAACEGVGKIAIEKITGKAINMFSARHIIPLMTPVSI
jgi:hypothetical protein